jgi:hypothetical protein
VGETGEMVGSFHGVEHLDGRELARKGKFYVKIIHLNRKIP